MANNTEQKAGPFIWGEGANASGQPDDTIAATAPHISRETFMDDTMLAFMCLYRSGVWHKGHNADLVDSKHATYLTTAVNSTEATYDPAVVDAADVDHPNLNDTTPAAPGGGVNVKWQTSGSNVSAYVPSTSLAPVDAQYVTLATNATLTNERVLTAGTGLDLADAGAGSTVTIDVDLNELTTATVAAPDHVVFVDADDSATKKTTVADLAVALAVPTTALTAAAVLADKAVVTGAGADRTTAKSDFKMTRDSTNVLSTASGAGIDFNAENLSNIGTIAATNLRNTLHHPPGQQAANLTDLSTFTDGDSHFVYLGRARAPITSVTLRYRVTTAFVDGGGGWAEVAIFKGTPSLGANASLTLLGYTDVSGIINSTGLKSTAITITAPAAGDELWACIGQDSAEGTKVQIRGVLADDLQTGYFQTATVQPSAAGSPQATTLAGATVVPPWFAVSW